MSNFIDKEVKRVHEHYENKKKITECPHCGFKYNKLGKHQESRTCARQQQYRDEILDELAREMNNYIEDYGIDVANGLGN